MIQQDIQLLGHRRRRGQERREVLNLVRRNPSAQEVVLCGNPTADQRDPSSGEEERCPWPTCVHRQITPALSERSRKRSRQLEAWIPKQWCYRHAWHTRLKKQPMFL